MLPDRIPLLEVSLGDNVGAGQLLRTSSYEFRYLSPDTRQPSVALLMPASTQLTWRDDDLIPSMDQNLPEGDRYTRFEGGPELEDWTMALKLFRGKHQTRSYPTHEKLLAFGRRLCGVANPEAIVQNIAKAMSETLHQSNTDSRIASTLHSSISAVWEGGLKHARST